MNAPLILQDGHATLLIMTITGDETEVIEHTGQNLLGNGERNLGNRIGDNNSNREQPLFVSDPSVPNFSQHTPTSSTHIGPSQVFKICP